MNVNKYYGSFLFLMILVIVFIATITYTNVRDEQKKKMLHNERERFLLTLSHDKLTVEDIVASTIYAMYESELVPISANANQYTRYNVWQSLMIRRGVPEVYTTPEVFEQIYKTCQKVTPQSIDAVIRPIYERERNAALPPPPAGFCPVCLNY
jgi:hypothetical protein